MFWDASAFVPLLVEQPWSEFLAGLTGSPRLVWWGTKVECASAICRLTRENYWQAEEAAQLLARLDGLVGAAFEVLPSDAVRTTAVRLLRIHSLRAADALQLAAALAGCEDDPAGFDFVCLDDRLRTAARLEGFRLQPPRL